jgi:hypothetical protein
VQEAKGLTPLHVSCVFGQLGVAAVLMVQGRAHAECRDLKGR